MKNIEPSYTSVQTALVRSFYTSFAVGLVALDMTGGYLLLKAPATSTVYLYSIVCSVFIFYIANKVLKRRRDFDVFLDLCLYDIAIQIFGLLARIYHLNPPEPAPLPYTVLALALEYMKSACLIWPLFINNVWPVIGPCSYLKRKALGNDEKTLFVATAKYDLPDGVVNTLVTALPIVCLAISYYTIVTFGKDRIDIRWAVCAFVSFIYIQQALITAAASDEVEKEL